MEEQQDKLSEYGPVHRGVAGNNKLSYGARALYALLCTFRNRDSICFPGGNILTQGMGADRSQINKWFIELEKAGAVERITRNKNTGERHRTIKIKDEIYRHSKNS